MKLAYWFVGTSCVGKTHYSISLEKNTKLKRFALDLIAYRKLDGHYKKIKGMSKEDAYKTILNGAKGNIILDGAIPFLKKNRGESVEEDRGIIENILKDYKIIYIFVDTDFKDYKTKYEERFKRETSEDKFKSNQDLMKSQLDKYITIKDNEDFKMLVKSVKGFTYQKDGFTDKKFEKLKVDAKGKSVIDLGCNAGHFEKYLDCKKYTGLDYNKITPILNENVHEIDLYKLEEWKEPADIVLCVSTFQHIKDDKDKFLKECRRLTNEMFVMECPIVKGDGDYMIMDRYQRPMPTQKKLEKWLLKHFKSIKLIGKSVPPDNSYRIVYHCFVK